MSCNSNNIAILIHTPPTADLEASELALALAAFDLPISLFFCGLGLTWLMPQNARKPQGKSATKVLTSLPLYGVDNIYYFANDNVTFNLNIHNFETIAQALDPQTWQQKIHSHKQCLVF